MPISKPFVDYLKIEEGLFWKLYCDVEQDNLNNILKDIALPRTNNILYNIYLNIYEILFLNWRLLKIPINEKKAFQKFFLLETCEVSLRILLGNTIAITLGTIVAIYVLNTKIPYDFKVLIVAGLIYSSIWLILTIIMAVFFICMRFFPKTFEMVNNRYYNYCDIWSHIEKLVFSTRFFIFIKTLSDTYLYSENICYGSVYFKSNKNYLVFLVFATIMDVLQSVAVSTAPFTWYWVVLINFTLCSEMLLRVYTCHDLYDQNKDMIVLFHGSATTFTIYYLLINSVTSFSLQRSLRASFRNRMEESKNAQSKKQIINMLCREVKIPSQTFTHILNSFKPLVKKLHQSPVDFKYYFSHVNIVNDTVNTIVDNTVFLARVIECRFQFKYNDRIDLRERLKNLLLIIQNKCLYSNRAFNYHNTFTSLCEARLPDITFESDRQCFNVLWYHGFLALTTIIGEKRIEKILSIQKQQLSMKFSDYDYDMQNNGMMDESDRRSGRKDAPSIRSLSSAGGGSNKSSSFYPIKLKCRLENNPNLYENHHAHKILHFSISWDKLAYLINTMGITNDDCDDEREYIPNNESSKKNTSSKSENTKDKRVLPISEETQKALDSICVICHKIVTTYQGYWKLYYNRVEFSLPCLYHHQEDEDGILSEGDILGPKRGGKHEAGVTSGNNSLRVVASSLPTSISKSPTKNHEECLPQGISHVVSSGDDRSHHYSQEFLDNSFRNFFLQETYVYISDYLLEHFLLDLLYLFPGGRDVKLYHEVNMADLNVHSIAFVQSIEACHLIREKGFDGSIVLFSEQFVYLDDEYLRSESIYDIGISLPYTSLERKRLSDWFKTKYQLYNMTSQSYQFASSTTVKDNENFDSLNVLNLMQNSLAPEPAVPENKPEDHPIFTLNEVKQSMFHKILYEFPMARRFKRFSLVLFENYAKWRYISPLSYTIIHPTHIIDIFIISYIVVVSFDMRQTNTPFIYSVMLILLVFAVYGIRMLLAPNHKTQNSIISIPFRYWWIVTCCLICLMVIFSFFSEFIAFKPVIVSSKISHQVGNETIPERVKEIIVILFPKNHEINFYKFLNQRNASLLGLFSIFTVVKMVSSMRSLSGLVPWPAGLFTILFLFLRSILVVFIYLWAFFFPSSSEINSLIDSYNITSSENAIQTNPDLFSSQNKYWSESLSPLETFLPLSDSVGSNYSSANNQYQELSGGSWQVSLLLFVIVCIYIFYATAVLLRSESFFEYLYRKEFFILYDTILSKDFMVRIIQLSRPHLSCTLTRLNEVQLQFYQELIQSFLPCRFQSIASYETSILILKELLDPQQMQSLGFENLASIDENSMNFKDELVKLTTKEKKFILAKILSNDFSKYSLSLISKNVIISQEIILQLHMLRMNSSITSGDFLYSNFPSFLSLMTSSILLNVPSDQMPSLLMETENLNQKYNQTSFREQLILSMKACFLKNTLHRICQYLLVPNIQEAKLLGKDPIPIYFRSHPKLTMVRIDVRFLQAMISFAIRVAKQRILVTTQQKVYSDRSGISGKSSSNENQAYNSMKYTESPLFNPTFESSQNQGSDGSNSQSLPKSASTFPSTNAGRKFNRFQNTKREILIVVQPLEYQDIDTTNINSEQNNAKSKINQPKFNDLRLMEVLVLDSGVIPDFNQSLPSFEPLKMKKSIFERNKTTSNATNPSPTFETNSQYTSTFDNIYNVPSNHHLSDGCPVLADLYLKFFEPLPLSSKDAASSNLPKLCLPISSTDPLYERIQYSTGAIQHSQYHSYQRFTFPYLFCPNSYNMTQLIEKTDASFRVYTFQNKFATLRKSILETLKLSGLEEAFSSNNNDTLSNNNDFYMSSYSNFPGFSSVNNFSSAKNNIYSSNITMPVPKMPLLLSKPGKVSILCYAGGYLHSSARLINQCFCSYSWSSSVFHPNPVQPLPLPVTFMDFDIVIIEYDPSRLKKGISEIRDIIHYFRAIEYQGMIVLAAYSNDVEITSNSGSNPPSLKQISNKTSGVPILPPFNDYLDAVQADYYFVSPFQPSMAGEIILAYENYYLSQLF